MWQKKRLALIGIFMAGTILGALAVRGMSEPASISPADFVPSDPADRPQTTVINITFRGMAQIGQVFMLEGIENTTSATRGAGGTYEISKTTSYPPLVLHGVFHKLMRDWRADVINGTVTKRTVDVDLMNSKNQRVLRVTFYNVAPVKFSLPPLSVDNSTRYMERMEFVYDYFEITN
ncbi:MAG: phage tail protein [bacterium]